MVYHCFKKIIQFSWLFCSHPYRISFGIVDMKRTDMIYMWCACSLWFLQVTCRHITRIAIRRLLGRFLVHYLPTFCLILQKKKKKNEKGYYSNIAIGFLFILPASSPPSLVLKILLFTNKLSNSTLTLTKNQGNYVPQLTNRGQSYYLIISLFLLLYLAVTVVHINYLIMSHFYED